MNLKNTRVWCVSRSSSTAFFKVPTCAASHVSGITTRNTENLERDGMFQLAGGQGAPDEPSAHFPPLRWNQFGLPHACFQKQDERQLWTLTASRIRKGGCGVRSRRAAKSFPIMRPLRTGQHSHQRHLLDTTFSILKELVSVSLQSEGAQLLCISLLPEVGLPDDTADSAKHCTVRRLHKVRISTLECVPRGELGDAPPVSSVQKCLLFTGDQLHVCLDIHLPVDTAVFLARVPVDSAV